MTKNSYSWNKLNEALSIATSQANSDAHFITSSSWQSIYPKTKEQCSKMQSLLEDSKDHIEDMSDTALLQCISKLESNLKYAGTRHRTWEWLMVGGVILAICICLLCNYTNLHQQHVSMQDIEKAKIFKIVACALVGLLVLYIVTGYPMGYTIKRFEGMKGVLNTLKYWGIRIAAATFGTGVVFSVVSREYYKWEKDVNGDWVNRKNQDTSFVRFFIKIGLIVIGIILFAMISVLITLVETVQGLIFNFDWKQKKNKTLK